MSVELDEIAKELRLFHSPSGPPPSTDDRSGFVILAALPLRPLIALTDSLSRRAGFTLLSLWAARSLLSLDRYAPEREGCYMNRAYTRLGLAQLLAGDDTSAIDSLRLSWRVHPCPHNTTFGHHPALWRALATVPEAEAARHEYAEAARHFSRNPHWPPRPLRWKEIPWRHILRSLTTRSS